MRDRLLLSGIRLTTGIAIRYGTHAFLTRKRWSDGEKRSLEGGGDGQKLNFIPWDRRFDQNEQVSHFGI